MNTVFYVSLIKIAQRVREILWQQYLSKRTNERTDTADGTPENILMPLPSRH